MLRIVAHHSAAAAASYYSQGLKREDYYTEGQEMAGKWYGLGAEMLGLSGPLAPGAFTALVKNRHPETGERITPRDSANRRVGYDLNFHAPKSLSLLYSITGDNEILEAFRASVLETMQDIEQSATTRVRVMGAQSERVTGNLAWAEFVHFTSRPIGGIPDPHLHVHAFAFNLTHDPVEERWKAASWAEIKRQAPYFQAAFHARLMHRLRGLGYDIEQSRRGWEVAGVSRELIEKFSRRTNQIEAMAREKGIHDPKALDALGASTRQGKRHGMTHDELLAAWAARLTDEEKVQLSKVRFQENEKKPHMPISVAQAFDYAQKVQFARNSVVECDRLVAETLKRGAGHVSPEQAWAELSRRGMIIRTIGNRHYCTSVDVLAEEVALINFVRNGRGMHVSLRSGRISLANSGLSDEQQRAVQHILQSRDQVIALRGGAGVGKTTLMKEAVRQIEESGRRVFAFAPSASASRETLRESGFADANTVAHLLNNPKLQERIRGQVLWVDEAGLLGAQDMSRIMEVAGKSTRVILTGDARQHGPVSRGDAFRLLQHHAGLRIAEVTEIRRQQRSDYRSAVEALSRGDVRTGFRRLDAMGAIIEVSDDAQRYRQLAEDYLKLSRGKNKPLVVSPTHAESAKVTQAIREAKREVKQLGKDREFTRYESLHWEEAERGFAKNYQPGLLVQFHQHAKGIRRGELFQVTGCLDDQVLMLRENGDRLELPLEVADRFQVFEQKRIAIAPGDRLKVTRNGTSQNGRRLSNGNVVEVEKFGKKGEIILRNGTVLDKDHGHFTHGYCQTSHSSQSKSVRDVLVAQSESSFRAGSTEQFYVSASRGKQSIRIYTDDRVGLQAAIGNSSLRQAGIELAGLNTDDISSMMSDDELTDTQWRDRVRSRVEKGQSNSHVKEILRQRKQNAPQKGESMNWREYIELRRKLSSVDGKKRSKGYPSSTEKKQRTKTQGKSLPKAVGPNTRTQKEAHKRAAENDKKEAEEKAKQEKRATARSTRASRIAKAYSSVVSKFKKAVNRTKQVKEKVSKTLQRSNKKQVAKHQVKQKAAKAVQKKNIQAKVKKQAPKPQPTKKGK